MQIHRKYFRVCAILMGLSFTGGLLWSICGIVIMHNKEQVVAGVCLTGLSAVGGFWSFLTYLLAVPQTIEPSIITIDVRDKSTKVLSFIVYDTDIVHVATGPNTPSKIVVFESHSESGNLI